MRDRAMKHLSILTVLTFTGGCAVTAPYLTHVRDRVSADGLPITLCLAVDLDPGVVSDVQDAAWAWNLMLGRAYFKLGCKVGPVPLPGRVTRPKDASIYIGRIERAQFSNPINIGWAHTWAGGANAPGVRGYVWVAEDVKEPRRKNVMTHELGHVLGLGHVERWVSNDNLVMHPIAQLTDWHHIDEAAVCAVKALWEDREAAEKGGFCD